MGKFTGGYRGALIGGIGDDNRMDPRDILLIAQRVAGILA